MSSPEIIRDTLKQEWNGLLAYHKSLSNRNYQAALNQYNRENPMEGTPVLTPKLKSQKFEGKTVEEAQAAAAMPGIAPEKIYDVKVTRTDKERTATGKSKSANAAIEAAKSRIKSQAFDIRTAEILQEGQEGVVEIQTQTETEARDQWLSKAPKGATLEAFDCVVAPRHMDRTARRSQIPSGRKKHRLYVRSWYRSWYR